MDQTPNGNNHIHTRDRSHSHFSVFIDLRKCERLCYLISSPRSKWGIHFSGHPGGSPRFTPSVHFRTVGVCAGGTALACVSSPCSQCAAWTEQLNRGESQPSLNVQLPQTHSFERSNAMLLLVSTSFPPTCLCLRAFLDNLQTALLLGAQFGLVRILHHSNT